MGDDLLIRVFGYPQKGSLKWHTCCASSVVYFLHRADYRNEAAGTFKVEERVLRLSQKESRDKGTNIFSSCGGSYHHHSALAVLSVVSSDSQSGFFR